MMTNKIKFKRLVGILVSVIFIFTSMTIVQAAFSGVQEETTSIFSLPSSSVKGQLNAFEIRGRTVTNLLGDRGSGTNMDVINSDSKITDSGDGYYLFTRNNTSSYQTTNILGSSPNNGIDTLKYYFFYGYIDAIDGINSKIIFTSNSAWTNGNSVNTKGYSMGKYAPNGSSAAGVSLYLEGTTGNRAKYKHIQVIEISQDEYNNLTVDELLAKYNYIKGTKSTLPARVKSVGKNLISPFIDPKWLIHTNAKIIDKDTLELNATVKWQSSVINIDAIPNQNYTLSFNVAGIGGYCSVKCLDSYGNNIYQIESIKSTDGDKTLSFTVPNNTKKISLQVTSTTSGTFIFSNIQLEYGTMATSYTDHEFSEVYINTTLRSLPNGVRDTVDMNTGVKTQNVSDEIILGGSFAWGFSEDKTGFKRVSLSTSMLDGVIKNNYTNQNTIVIKHDGKIINNYFAVGDFNSGDIWHWDGNIDYFAVTIDDSDSGWGEAYIPSQADIQAYFNAHPYTLIYQLAQEQTTNIPTTPLIAYPDGTVIIEPAVNEVGIYNSGIAIDDPNLPIESIDWVKKINNNSSRVVIDKSNITISADGKSFTINDVNSGQSYEYAYMYPSELSTIPTITYSVPIDQSGQIEGNTNMIQRHSDLIDTILHEIKLLRGEINSLGN